MIVQCLPHLENFCFESDEENKNVNKVERLTRDFIKINKNAMFQPLTVTNYYKLGNKF